MNPEKKSLSGHLAEITPDGDIFKGYKTRTTIPELNELLFTCPFFKTTFLWLASQSEKNVSA